MKKEGDKMAMIQVDHLSFGYPGKQENVFEDATFLLETDWKLGVIGRNGKGKTTLLKLLNGEYSYQGKIQTKIQFEYFPFSIKNPNQMTYDIVKEIVPQVEDWKILKEMSLLEVKAEALYQPFETLSGGEQIKMLLVAMFQKENTFFLIDEPTNHIDEQTKKLLAQYFSKKKGFLLVSHDRKFLDEVIDHVLVIQNTKIRVVQGNFSTWKEEEEKQEAFEEKQFEKKRKEMTKLEKAKKESSEWADKIEQTKYGTRNSGLRVDRGYIGHQSAKMMKKAKGLERRREKAVEEKKELLLNQEKKEDLKMSYQPSDRKTLLWVKDLKTKYGKGKEINFSLENGERIILKRKKRKWEKYHIKKYFKKGRNRIRANSKK